MSASRRPLALVALLAGALLVTACNVGGGGDPGEIGPVVDQLLTCVEYLDREGWCSASTLQSLLASTVSMNGTAKTRQQLVGEWTTWVNDPDDMRKRWGAPYYHHAVDSSFSIVNPGPTTAVVNGSMEGSIERGDPSNPDKFVLPRQNFQIRVIKTDAGSWVVTEMNNMGPIWGPWYAGN